MKNFTIKIKTKGAAFRSGLDTAEDRAEWVAERLSADLFENGGEVPLFDVNGNLVGSIVVK